MSQRQRYLEKLSLLAISDLVGQRPCERLERIELDTMASQIIQEASRLSFVYTAFDGDHQMFCSQMRQYVRRAGKTPVNPDSVLGYVDTVSFRQSKRGVLLDDLSILRGCDELWVFTDCPCTSRAIGMLAEGVLIELLFFLKRNPRRPVKFASISKIATGGGDPDPQEWPLGYDETVALLSADQRKEILELANSGSQVDKQLREVRYFLHDPIDYKYARFVRAGAYRPNEVPLVPFLAARVEDAATRAGALAETIIHWAKLMSLASKCTRLPSIDLSREQSQLVEVLERVWLRKTGASQLESGDWGAYKVPKANQKGLWAITAKERARW